MNKIVKEILQNRGIAPHEYEDFLNPDYNKQHDPFLLPDMKLAVERLVEARKNQEKITIYGDYDVDGVTSCALLLDAFASFGFENVDFFLPDRFIDGYGMNANAVEVLSERGTELIVTVDCGSLNHSEIELANSLSIDVIVTDHHNIAEVQPAAIAIVNPQRKENEYPEAENFAGVGVAFKLVQALSFELKGIDVGQEKWLLDLVALGTVCDIVQMSGENRQNVFWGLKVLQKTRRLGLKSMLALAEIEKISTSTLGFVLGPRINAAGRLKNAQIALDLVNEKNGFFALEKAKYLDELNSERKKIQEIAFEKAEIIAQKYKNDNVLVVSDESFNNGIIGIVASKLMERFKKPIFVISVESEESKGSARSFGDFSASEAVDFAREIIIKGGGHNAAAGVTLATEKIDDFRRLVNEFYSSLKLKNQLDFLSPRADIELNSLESLTVPLFQELRKLEPFGPRNEEPVFFVKDLEIVDKMKMGANKQHVKYTFLNNKQEIKMIKFNAGPDFQAEIGEVVNVYFNLGLNEWRGRQNVEGMILHLRVNEL